MKKKRKEKKGGGERRTKETETYVCVVSLFKRVGSVVVGKGGEGERQSLG